MNARTLALIGTAAGFLAVAACEQSSSPDRVSAPTGGPQSESEQAPAEAPTVGDTSEAAESASAQAGDMWSGERVYAGNVSFGVPEGWVVRPPSNQMRAAEVAAPGDGGGTGPVAAFSLAGGGAEANGIRVSIRKRSTTGGGAERSKRQKHRSTREADTQQ